MGKSGIHPRETKRRCEKTRGLRGKIKPCRIRSPDDGGKSSERLRPKVELLDHDVEGAELTPMAPKHPLSLNVERRAEGSATPWTCEGATKRKMASGSTKRRMSQDRRPGRSLVGTAIHRLALPIAGWKLGLRNHGQSCLRPGESATIEGSRLHALIAEPSRNALAELEALLTDDDGVSACQLEAHSGTLARAATGAGNETGIGLEILIGPNVDENWAFLCADQAGKLSMGNDVERRHGASVIFRADAMLGHVALWGDREPPCPS